MTIISDTLTYNEIEVTFQEDDWNIFLQNKHDVKKIFRTETSLHDFVNTHELSQNDIFEIGVVAVEFKLIENAWEVYNYLTHNFEFENLLEINLLQQFEILILYAEKKKE